MNKQQEQSLRELLVKHLGADYRECRLQRSGMGCINETWQVSGAGLTPVFVKQGEAERLAMYQAEAEGLAALRAAQSIRVPGCYAVDADELQACLLLEFIELKPLDAQGEARFGEALAALHGVTVARYGFAQDNYLGRSLQANTWEDDWWTFYCEHRLGIQLSMAAGNGMRSALVDKVQDLIERVPSLFAEHQPAASLLHGDLWSGNVAADAQGLPVIYDPAVYYGDAETDLAMSRLFGGLGESVYQRYFALRPALPGIELRQPLYDAYHWLNHFNLFGVIYLGQLESCVDAIYKQLN